MAVTNKRDWLEKGKALLEELGAEALTIEMLTKQFHVTKGAFYHHFQNSQDFKEQLLAAYEEERTHQVIRLAEREPSPQARLERIIQITLQSSPLEVAIRAWALQDALVRAYQQRIDQQRLTYLEELIFAMIGDHAQAARMARLFYSVYVGSQHILPPIQGDDLASLYQDALPFLSFVFDPQGAEKNEREKQEYKRQDEPLNSRCKRELRGSSSLYVIRSSCCTTISVTTGQWTHRAPHIRYTMFGLRSPHAACLDAYRNSFP